MMSHLSSSVILFSSEWPWRAPGTPRHSASDAVTVTASGGQHFTLLQSSIFSPLTLPSPGLRQCEGRKNAAPTYHRRYPANNLRLERLPGGFRKGWDHPNDLLSVPAVTAASHSLLHAPKGDPRKPGRSPPIYASVSQKEHQVDLRRLHQVDTFKIHWLFAGYHVLLLQ